MRSFIPLLGAALLCASCIWPVERQTTLDGNLLAYRSTGTPCDNNAWRLSENGFVGAYIRLAAEGEVSFTIRASKASPEAPAPMLGLRVADFAASWPVNAAGDNYSSHTRIWTLPAGTYCVRVENVNSGPLAIEVRDLTIAGAAVLNGNPSANALAAADTYIDHFRRGPARLTLTVDRRPIANTRVRIRLKRHAFNFGTAVATSSWITGPGENDSNYRKFVIENFNTVVPENAGKWHANERVRDRVTLDYLDSIMKFAELNGKRVRMHGVLWDVAEPAWVDALQNRAVNGTCQTLRDAAKTDLRAEISERIQYFVRNRAGLAQPRHDQPPALDDRIRRAASRFPNAAACGRHPRRDPAPLFRPREDDYVY